MASDDEITPILNAEESSAQDIDSHNESDLMPGLNGRSKTVNTSNEGEDEDEVAVELTGCGAGALCDPRRTPHRFIALLLMCILGFGSTFCYDNPGALQDNLRTDMGINTAQFANLYAWYSWPNVICCFIGGFLLDR
jgi:hypothetical protein